jgi:ankyrin repeat protein
MNISLENERLIQACCRNDIEAVKWLLENSERNPINFQRGINRSALHEAVLHHDGRELVRLLCQYGADPQQRDSLG